MNPWLILAAAIAWGGAFISGVGRTAPTSSAPNNPAPSAWSSRPANKL